MIQPQDINLGKVLKMPPRRNLGPEVVTSVLLPERGTVGKPRASIDFITAFQPRIGTIEVFDGPGFRGSTSVNHAEYRKLYLMAFHGSKRMWFV